MSGVRIQADMYFKGFTTLAGVIKAYPHLEGLVPIIKAAKLLATKINPDKDNEEMTITARWHLCNHDVIPVKPCGVEKEI